MSKEPYNDHMITRGSLCRIATKEFKGRKKDCIGLFPAPGFLADIEEELDVADSATQKTFLGTPSRLAMRERSKVMKLGERCIGKVMDGELVTIIDIVADHRDHKTYYKVLTSKSQRIGWCRNTAVYLVSNPND